MDLRMRFRRLVSEQTLQNLLCAIRDSMDVQCAPLLSLRLAVCALLYITVRGQSVKSLHFVLYVPIHVESVAETLRTKTTLLKNVNAMQLMNA